MHSTYDTAMTRGVFPHEGGYTNDAADPGGPTNWGITIFDARMYWKKNATASDVRNMPKSVAEDIYAKHYAAPLRYNELPAGVDYSVLDYGINSGIGRAGKVLRRLVGLSDKTSAITDDVIAAVSKRDPKALIAAIAAERLAFLKRLKTWPVFGTGWGRRVAEVKALSLSFAAQSDALPVLSNAAAPGKGHVAPPPTPVAQAIAKVGAPTGVAATAAVHTASTLHIATSIAFGVGAIVVVGGVAYVMVRRHKAAQEAATPGIAPVPVAA